MQKLQDPKYYGQRWASRSSKWGMSSWFSTKIKCFSESWSADLELERINTFSSSDLTMWFKLSQSPAPHPAIIMRTSCAVRLTSPRQMLCLRLKEIWSNSKYSNSKAAWQSVSLTCPTPVVQPQWKGNIYPAPMPLPRRCCPNGNSQLQRTKCQN